MVGVGTDAGITLGAGWVILNTGDGALVTGTLTFGAILVVGGFARTKLEAACGFSWNFTGLALVVGVFGGLMITVCCGFTGTGCCCFAGMAWNLKGAGDPKEVVITLDEDLRCTIPFLPFGTVRKICCGVNLGACLMTGV